ncbi:MAG: CHAT domain-containing protein [Anaerolineales bacterium]|jgi:CHAT domain-containing protein
MSHDDFIRSFQRLADQAFNRQISDEIVREEKSLALLDQQFLDDLTQEARTLSLESPYRALALMEALDKSAGIHSNDLYLQSLAAWHLAWAGNEVMQPTLVKEAVERAKRGFEQIKDRKWLAACTWQYYAIPWTRNNLIRAKDELNNAFGNLRKTQSLGMAAQCQLSLASAQMLVGDIKEALSSSNQGEKYFSLQDDRLNQARAWMVQANIFRRESKFDESAERFFQAIQVFADSGAIIDLAKANYRLGLLYYLSAQDFQLALSYLEKALAVFEQENLEILKALCCNGLAQVNTDMGNISEAGRLLETVREIYKKYEIFSIRADNLHDYGRLERMRGRFSSSILCFKQSEELYTKAGLRLMSILSMKEIGGTYGDLGRFQDCLHYLERARNNFTEIKDESRIAECDLSIAQVWMKLGFPNFAEDHLGNAEAICQRLRRDEMLPEIYNSHALLLLSHGDIKAAVERLENALSLTKIRHMEHEAALSNRLLGEAFLSDKRYDKSIYYFEIAEKKFAELGMGFDRAYCLFYLAEIYNELGDDEQAVIYYKEALKESGGVVYEIEWRVYGGLARLAEKEDHLSYALENYKKAMAALGMIRDQIWQPSLVQEYLTVPTQILNKAVDLSGMMGLTSDTLELIEGGKSRAFLYQLNQFHRVKNVDESLDLANMRAVIIWLQDQLKSQMAEKRQLPIAMYKSELHNKLLESMGEYNRELEKIERQYFISPVAPQGKDGFNLESFQQFAVECWGEDWVAIDYYFTEDTLTGVWFTRDSSHLWQTNISTRAQIALGACEKVMKQADVLNDEDLSVLGSLLIPKVVLEQLNLETKLLLSPHGRLHRIPWAILRVGDNNKSLVESCTPVNVISLQALRYLKLRNGIDSQNKLRNGMVIAVSHFGDRYKALSNIDDEVEVLNKYLGNDGKALIGNDATWRNLKAISEVQQEEKRIGLSRFSFLHIASHIFSDPRTGRLSGIALSDSDVWLDQLNDLAPLSRLVVLSGCNGIQNRIFTGDEHLGVAIRCLLAGAQVVVGSLWPVLDSSTVDLMNDFYAHLIDHGSPSSALAHMQRKAIHKGVPLNAHGGYSCIGMP